MCAYSNYRNEFLVIINGYVEFNPTVRGLIKHYLGVEFVNKVGESPEKLEIGYFKGNKRIWMQTSHQYSDVLEK